MQCAMSVKSDLKTIMLSCCVGTVLQTQEYPGFKLQQHFILTV